MKSNVDRDVWFPIFNLGLLVKLMYVNLSKFTSIPWPYAKYVGNAGVFSRIYNPRPAFFGKIPACTCSWHRLESTKSIRSKRENGKIGCDAARFSRFCEFVWVFESSPRVRKSIVAMLCGSHDVIVGSSNIQYLFVVNQSIIGQIESCQNVIIYLCRSCSVVNVCFQNDECTTASRKQNDLLFLCTEYWIIFF